MLALPQAPDPFGFFHQRLFAGQLVLLTAH